MVDGEIRTGQTTGWTISTCEKEQHVPEPACHHQPALGMNLVATAATVMVGPGIAALVEPFAAITLADIRPGTLELKESRH